jgi:hypothetical protein
LTSSLNVFECVLLDSFGAGCSSVVVGVSSSEQSLHEPAGFSNQFKSIGFLPKEG